ncbi:MAG TPA: hypothetical protein VM077_00835 [Candidatus Limnocylindrales bacterium]|nr:hypothetical protein [Candidatus Limnocylindrales bacterium]
MLFKNTIIIFSIFILLVGALSLPLLLRKKTTSTDTTKTVAIAESKYEKIPNANDSEKHDEVHGNLHQELETSVKFGDNEIIVTNGEKTDLIDCTLEMNATIAQKGYTLTKDLIPAQESVTISLSEFSRNGVAFDTSVKNANNVMIMCSDSTGRSGWSYLSNR